MSLVVLHHSDALSIVTSKRVVGAKDVGALQSLCEHASTLSEHLIAEEARIKESEEQARITGHRAGFEAGKQEGLSAAALEISGQRKALDDAQAMLETQATTMAFDIVRRLADTLEPAELLCALAISAAQACEPDETLVLRVHDSHRGAVEEKLASKQSEASRRIVRVVGDSDIENMACIIESTASRILADLHTQTDSLESKLVNG